MRDRRSDGNYNRRVEREGGCRVEEGITAEAEIVVSLEKQRDLDIKEPAEITRY